MTKEQLLTGIVVLDSIPLYPDDPRARATGFSAIGGVVPFSASPVVPQPTSTVPFAAATPEQPASSSADIRRALGISEATWRKYNHDEPVQGVQAFAAGTPSLDDLKVCSEFLGRLICLGMEPATAMRSEDLYFKLVRAPRDSKYETESSGRYEGTPVDIEKAQKAMRDVLKLDDDSEDPSEKKTAGEVWDALMQLDHFLMEQARTQAKTDHGHIPFRPSLAEMLRAAAFIAFAHTGGVWDGRELKLADLFWEYRNKATPSG